MSYDQHLMNEQSELDLNCFLDGFGTQRVPPLKSGTSVLPIGRDN